MEEIKLIIDPKIKNGLIYYVNVEVVYISPKNTYIKPDEYKTPFTLALKERLIEKAKNNNKKNKIKHIKIDLLSHLGKSQIN